jgi:hypothetical protein
MHLNKKTITIKITLTKVNNFQMDYLIIVE